MRKTVAVAVVVLLGALGIPAAISWWNDRPIRGPIVYWLFFDDTRYAPNYSERAFSEVRMHMPKSEVEKLLGLPLEIMYTKNGRITERVELGDGGHSTYPDLPADPQNEPTETIYYYSRPGTKSDHWFVRAVVFSEAGRVKSISREFDAD